MQLIAGPDGFVQPLCENCRSLDCTNPIEKKKISVIGVVKDSRIYVRGNEAHFVIECQGFIK